MATTRLEASAAFCETFAYLDLARDVATGLSCNELDALALLLHSHGYTEAAAYWEECHAAGDEEGDSHYSELTN